MATLRPGARAIAAAALLALLAGCAGAPKQPSSPGAGRVERAGPGLPRLPAAGSGRGGYYQDDGPGDNPPPNLDQVADAEPRLEPYSKRGNRPYVVFGKTYTPRTDERPFYQRGVGSWYGKKFHGQRTSSGELYDMYKMTAAHPTLPIPSYARITSVASGKQVIVRVNDRGPFHSRRIVDVSYTAALKLGLLDKGSHEVELERLLPAEIERLSQLKRRPQATLPIPAPGPALADSKTVAVAIDGSMQDDRMAPAGDDFPAPSASAWTWSAAAAPAASALPVAPAAPAPPAPPAAADKGGFYLQLGAYASADKAEAVRAKLHQQGPALAPLEVVAGALHRIYSGPFESRAQAARAARTLPAALAVKPIIVER
jgi:rare lipoprotein A